jgi:enamine deaminase RidA (YjgF/YER057c/UK114 family)
MILSVRHLRCSNNNAAASILFHRHGIKNLFSCSNNNNKIYKNNITGAGLTMVPPRRYAHVERRIESLGITLPPAAAPRANYNVVCRASGNMLYISGHLPFQLDGSLMTGKIDDSNKERNVEYGYQAARWAGLNIVSTLKERLGDLDKVEQIVKIFGIVQSSDQFKHQHLVMDGCSDVMMEIFGPTVGYHARSAIGTSTLPLDISVEVEAIVQLKEE